VIYREELPDGSETSRALSDLFGAEPGDEVVEVRLDGLATLSHRRWTLAAVDSSAINSRAASLL
jgi:hypothetical protein